MKISQLKFFPLLLLVVVAALTFCSKELDSTKNKSKLVVDEDYRVGNLENAFSIHNEVMDEIFDNEIQYLDDFSYIESIIKSVENKVNFRFDNNQKEFMHKMFNSYLKLNTKDMVDKFVEDGMMSPEGGEVFMLIDRHMLSKELLTYEEISQEIAFVKANLIENNLSLSDFDEHQLGVFLQTVDNSARHYQRHYDNSNLKGVEKMSENCGKCIRRNLWQILLGDGVGGAVLGITGCLLFPPACPAIIPTLIAIGSGGVVALRCPQC